MTSRVLSAIASVALVVATYAAPQSVLDNYEPPQFLPPVQFCETHGRQHHSYSPQERFDLALTPYMREPLECLADSRIEIITLEWASQLGKTVYEEKALMHFACQAPGPCMWVFPDEDLQHDFLKKRLKRTIEATPIWREKLDRGLISVTDNGVSFKTMEVFAALASSESDLSSRPSRYVIADEVDKYPEHTTREGSPLDQARKRQRWYAGRGRKMIVSSTPTDSRSMIDRWFRAGDQRRYHVPCLSCGIAHPWEWERVKWDTPDPDLTGGKKLTHAQLAEMIQTGELDVYYECPSCGHHHTTWREQLEMNRRGAWVRHAPTHNHASFHLSSMAAPIQSSCSWRGLAITFLEALVAKSRGDEDPIKTFLQHELARTYTPRQVIIREQALVDRMSLLPAGIVPREAHIITAGIDVQHDRWYWVAHAWWSVAGADGEVETRCHMVDHGCVEGHFAGASALTTRLFEVEGGGKRPLDLALMDSGDGMVTADVYALCSRLGDRSLLPVKGDDEKGFSGGHFYTIAARPLKDQQIDRHEKERRQQAQRNNPLAEKLINCNVVAVKDFVSALLQKPLPTQEERETGTNPAMTYHYGIDQDSDLQRQLVSEERANVPTARGKRRVTWRKRDGYDANHYKDAETYSACAAVMRGILAGQRTTQTKRRRRRMVGASVPDPWNRSVRL